MRRTGGKLAARSCVFVDERTGTVQTQQTETGPPQGPKQKRAGLAVALAAVFAVIVIGGVIAFTGRQTANAPSEVAVTGDMILARDVLPGGMASGMEDIIEIESLLTVDRGAYDSASPERLDIVLFSSEIGRAHGLADEFPSRVIGLPGETIEAREGSLYVDDRVLDEPYLKNPQLPMLPFGPVTLGADELWLMGDNRQTPHFSRYFGPIPVSLLRGKITEISTP